MLGSSSRNSTSFTYNLRQIPCLLLPLSTFRKNGGWHQILVTAAQWHECSLAQFLQQSNPSHWDLIYSTDRNIWIFLVLLMDLERKIMFILVSIFDKLYISFPILSPLLSTVQIICFISLLVTKYLLSFSPRKRQGKSRKDIFFHVSCVPFGLILKILHTQNLIQFHIYSQTFSKESILFCFCFCFFEN